MKWKTICGLVLSSFISHASTQPLAKPPSLQDHFKGKLEKYQGYEKADTMEVYIDINGNGLIDTMVVGYDMDGDHRADVEEYYHMEHKGRRLIWHKTKPYAITFNENDGRPIPKYLWFNKRLGPFHPNIIKEYLDNHPMDQYEIEVVEDKLKKL